MRLVASRPLPAHLAEWLSLIRYQALAADELSRQQPPINATAINAFQDVAEAFIRLGAEHLGTAPKGQDFLAAFDALDKHPTIGGALAGHRTRLDALNKARVGFKHHGNRPDAATLERSRINLQEFLEDASQKVLGVNFDQVSLTAFIRDTDGRRYTEEAAAQWEAGATDDAMTSLAKAFLCILADYEHRKLSRGRQSIFNTQPSFMLSSWDARELGIQKVIDWISAIDERTKLLAFGIDLRRHAYFKAYTPHVYGNINGNLRAVPRDPAPLVTHEIFQRCYRFVIDSALSLAAEDYDLGTANTSAGAP